MQETTLVEKQDLYELLAGRDVVLVLTNGERWSGRLLISGKDKRNLALLREKGVLVINRRQVIYARLRGKENGNQDKKRDKTSEKKLNKAKVSKSETKAEK
mgnify:CR=1 FL=1